MRPLGFMAALSAIVAALPALAEPTVIPVRAEEPVTDLEPLNITALGPVPEVGEGG